MIVHLPDIFLLVLSADFESNPYKSKAYGDFLEERSDKVRTFFRRNETRTFNSYIL